MKPALYTLSPQRIAQKSYVFRTSIPAPYMAGCNQKAASDAATQSEEAKLLTAVKKIFVNTC